VNNIVARWQLQYEVGNSVEGERDSVVKLNAIP
jgi:hypothetical protein